MTEGEARDWLEGHVPRETLPGLSSFADMVLQETQSQNLIAASTKPEILARHIVDSAQLHALAPTVGDWLDLGSGAGFPGIVIALLRRDNVYLAEARAKRAAFLQAVIDRLGIAGSAQVLPCRVETLAPKAYAVISARAFAPLDRLFATAHHLAGTGTRWILPKGRGARVELDQALGSWQGDFTIVPSVTDADGAIIVAENVRPRGGAGKHGMKR